MARKKALSWIGLDIGGANIKIADTTGRAAALDFPLWKQPQKLASALKKLLRAFGDAKQIAVTMTGELADCFQTKREGVSYIAKASAEAAPGAELHFYSVKGEFLSLSEAIIQWKNVAASNWHALASWLAANSPSSHAGLVIDIGSTTTDIVPFIRKKVCCKGLSDTTRLLHGELVYTGIERSSIAGITPVLPFKGKLLPVMNELFATSLDAWLLLGEIAEDDRNTATADGRAANKQFAHARLARMVGGDLESISPRETLQMAKFIAQKQTELIAGALAKVRDHRPQEIHFTGHGAFLARRALKLASIVGGPYEGESFGDKAGMRSAPAIAVAMLAQQHFQP